MAAIGDPKRVDLLDVSKPTPFVRGKVVVVPMVVMATVSGCAFAQGDPVHREPDSGYTYAPGTLPETRDAGDVVFDAGVPPLDADVDDAGTPVDGD